MRSITIILALLLSLSGVSWVSYSYVHSTALALDKHLSIAEQSLRQGEWEQARLELKTTQNDWNRHKNILTVLIDHQDINTIDLTLLKIDTLAENHLGSLSLTELVALRRTIENIRDQETLTLSNIF